MKSYIEQRNRYLRKVLERYHEGFNCYSISRIYPVHPDTIRRWCIKFAEYPIDQLPMEKKPSAKKTAEEPKTVPLSEYEELQTRVNELEAQLKRESMRAAFYDEMINVAEAKFNIPIRKKAGTKQ